MNKGKKEKNEKRNRVSNTANGGTHKNRANLNENRGTFW